MEKPSLVMVHGLVGSLHYFQPQNLIANATVENVDLLGYGEYGDFSPDGLSLAAQAEHVSRWVGENVDKPVWLLGHSMGGAIVMLLADIDPDSILGIINVEGNFTLEDTFWSRKIISDPPEVWHKKYARMLSDIPGCLSRWGISNTAQREQWLRHVMANQPSSTVYAMAYALVKETADPEYLQAVNRVAQRIPIHLVAGERSAAAWGVPEFVREQAASDHLQPDTGHLMMLEQPSEFCRIVDRILLASRG